MDTVAAPAKAPVEQPPEQPDAGDMLVITGASGVAAPLAGEWEPKRLRDLTTRDTVIAVSKALDEPEPADNRPAPGPRATSRLRSR